MAITLRSVKGAPLTTEELDGNFTDLDTRVSDIEENGAGGGIAFTTGTGIALSAEDVLSHGNTTSISGTSNTGNRVITNVGIDQFGHVTFLGTLNLDTEFLQLSGGTLTGSLTLNTGTTLTAHTLNANSLTVVTNATVGGNVTADSFTSSGTGVPTITSASNIVLDAASSVVIQGSPLRFKSYTTVEANALSGVTGEVIYVSDGDAGSPSLAVYDGSDWRRVALGAAISST